MEACALSLLFYPFAQIFDLRLERLPIATLLFVEHTRFSYLYGLSGSKRPLRLTSATTVCRNRVISRSSLPLVRSNMGTSVKGNWVHFAPGNRTSTMNLFSVPINVFVFSIGLPFELAHSTKISGRKNGFPNGRIGFIVALLICSLRRDSESRAKSLTSSLFPKS